MSFGGRGSGSTEGVFEAKQPEEGDVVRTESPLLRPPPVSNRCARVLHIAEYGAKTRDNTRKVWVAATCAAAAQTAKLFHIPTENR